MQFKDFFIVLCLAFAGCFHREVESKPLPLYKNPLDAALGKHKHESEHKIDRIIEDSFEKTRDAEDEYEKYIDETYDITENGRGSKLAEKLIEQLSEKDYKARNLLIVDAGSNHMYAIGKRLKDKFNLYFVDESSFVESYEEFSEPNNMYYYFAQFYNKEMYETMHNPKKCNAIIYGDNHSKDFEDLRKFLPLISELKKQGLRKIVYAKEGIKSAKRWSIKNFRFDENNSLRSYLREAEKNGIKVSCIGIEYQE